MIAWAPALRPREAKPSVAKTMNTGMKMIRTHVTIFAGVQMLVNSFCGAAAIV